MNRTGGLFTGFPLCDGLPDGDLDHLESAARPAGFAEGERIFEQDQPANACWLVARGRVAIDSSVPGRDPVLIQTLGPGDVLGWSWLVPPYRWHFGAFAVDATTAIELDAGTLRALAEAHPDFGYRLATRLLQVTVDRLQATRARLLDLYGNPR